MDRAAQFGAQPPAGGRQVFERLLYHSDLPAQGSPVGTTEDAVRMLTAGFALLMLDGWEQGIAFSVQSLQFRSIEEPSGEGSLRGSREGFADLLRVNLSLLRRLVRTGDLVMGWPRPTPPCGPSTPCATAATRRTRRWWPGCAAS